MESPVDRRKALKTIGGLSAVLAGGAAAGVAADRYLRSGDSAARTEKPAPALATAKPSDRARGHGMITWAVETRKKLIALTFDDGPVPNYTPLVLDALDEEKVPATFFLVGRTLTRNPKILDGRIDRHEIGNHSWLHKSLNDLGDYEAVRTDLTQAHEAIAKITGREVRLLRPPFGHLGAVPMRVADGLGYRVVLWSQGVVEASFQKDPDSVIPYVVDNVTPGTIFLAHDAVNTYEPVFLRRLGPIIRQLRAKGYEFVTVSDLMAEREEGATLITTKG
ncbi:hypothetical protein GCM10009555_040330 [Acrocarpospora macrocephala]|uniref:NodB homology domain-containing protein n=1 Tax=Acrocarpospora macrocephala TaxID=150177 RepID=A0A5M3WM92_9ACTN|nr:polysaccharide deacetylase family protein [Acrocarpospora macrocephala]GES09994.1 hypothetical protein Amac_035900 [Acrocarpospora macrocephala]